jgi:outer membrane lipoprotein-sorting protein
MSQVPWFSFAANRRGLARRGVRTLFQTLIICVAGLLAAPLVRADASNVLNRVRTELSGQTSVRAMFTQEKELSLFKQKLVIKGRLLLDDKGSLLWITDEPIRSAVTIRDGTLRQWDGESGHVTSLPVKRIPALPALMGQLQSWLRGDFDALVGDADVCVEKETPPTLVCTPKQEDASPFSSVTLTLNENPFYVRQVEITETSGNHMTLRFEHVELNGAVQDSDWLLPPKQP